MGSDRRTLTTSPKSIYEEWRDKVIKRSGDVTSLPCVEDDDIAAVLEHEDDGKYCCWACGASGVTLNRCHIVPHALGGSDEPSNLFLMCEACHAESPDTANPASLMRWVWRKRRDMVFGEVHPRKFLEDVDEELVQRNGRTLSDEIAIAVAEGRKIEWNDGEAMSLYGSITNNHHGVSYSTRVCAYADVIEHFVKKPHS